MTTKTVGGTPPPTCRHDLGPRQCGLKVYRKGLCSQHYWATQPGADAESLARKGRKAA